MKLMSFHVGAFSGMSRGGPYDGHVACLRENQPEVCPGGMSFFAGGFGAYPNRWRSADGVWREVPGRGHELNAAAVRLHCTRLMNHLHQILLGFPVATTDNKPFDLWCVDYEGGESDELPSLGARHKPTGAEYRIGDTLDRGDEFNQHARLSKVTRLYRTPMGWVVAAVKYHDGVDGLLGLHPGSGPATAWEVDSDVRFERGDCRCAFCGRTVVVHLWNNRKRDKCPCGARHFFRRVRQGGKVVAESEGWRKNGKEIERC